MKPMPAVEIITRNTPRTIEFLAPILFLMGLTIQSDAMTYAMKEIDWIKDIYQVLFRKSSTPSSCFYV
jgi:hypothetical protein